MNTTGLVFTSRLTGRQLLDSDGLAVGRVRDVVILPTAGGEPPWVLGLVVTLHRRPIFVNLGRLAEISVNGAYLRGGTVDLRRFSPAPARSWPRACTAGRPATAPWCSTSASPARSAAAAAGRSRPGHRPGPRAAPPHDHRGAVGPAPRAVQVRRAGRPARLAAGDAPDRPGRRGRGHAADAGATSWPPRSRTRSWPTCWRSCPRQDQIRLLAGPRAGAHGRRRRGDGTRRRRRPAGRDARRAARTAAGRDGEGPGRGPAPAAALRRHHGRRPDDLPAADRRARTRRWPRCWPGSGSRRRP